MVSRWSISPLSLLLLVVDLSVEKIGFLLNVNPPLVFLGGPSSSSPPVTPPALPKVFPPSNPKDVPKVLVVDNEEGRLEDVGELVPDGEVLAFLVHLAQ